MSFRNLPASLQRLVVIGALFTLAVSLSATFVNMYLWKQQKSLILLALYTGVQFVMMPAMFYLTRSLQPRRVEPYMRIGISLHVAFYALVLLVGDRANPLWLGALLGGGQGFYWFAFNLLALRISHGPERLVFNSLTGTFNSLSNMLAPLLAGYLIANLWPQTGYKVIFTASLVLFGVVFFVSMRMRGEVFQDRLAPLFRRRHPSWNRVLVGSVFQGLREGVFSFLPAILIFVATNNEASLGRFVALTAFLSSCSFYMIGRVLKQKGYNEAMLAGSFLGTSAIALFLYDIRFSTILIYGIVTALCSPFFNVPFGTRVFQVIDDADELYEREYIAEREILLNLGRVLSIATFVLTTAYLHRRWLPVYLLVIGSMQVIAVLIMRTVQIRDRHAKSRA